MHRLLLLLAVLLTALPVRAQITITQSDVEAQLSRSGTALAYDIEASAALQALADASGANQTWDFTGLADSLFITSTFGPVNPPVPGSDDPHLAQATHITRSTASTSTTSDDSTAYVFQQLTASGLTNLGVASEADLGSGDIDTVGVKFVPGDLEFPLPLTFGATWTSAYESEFIPDFGPFLSETEEDEEVVGWGTLILPGSSAAALMVRTRTISTTTITGIPPIVDTSYTVTFITKENFGASIFLDGEFQVQSGSYSVIEGGTTAAEPGTGADPTFWLAEAAPNPVRQGGTVEFAFSLAAPTAVRLEVYDLLGRRVATLADAAQTAGEHRLTWVTGAEAAGVYVVRLTAGGHTLARRMTVVR